FSRLSLTAQARGAFQRGRRIIFDSANAEKCLSETRQASCAELINFLGASLYLKECRETFKGTLKPGRSCRSSECEPGSICTADIMGIDCVGICNRRVKAGGQLSDYSTNACEEGLIQFRGTCYAPRREGEQCFTTHDMRFGCGRGLFCNRSLVCEGQKPEGAPCSDPHECFSLLECDGRCRPHRWLRLGDLCGSAACTSWSCPMTPCLPDLTCSNDLNRCSQRSQEGQSCRSAECAPGLWCDINGACRKPSAAGGPCSPSWYGTCDTALGLFCDSDLVCKTRKPIGATCSNMFQCASLNCQCTREAP